MELFLQKKEEEEIISHKFALTTTNCGLQQLLSCTWPRLSQCEQAVKYLKVAVFNLQPLWSWLSTNTKKWKFSSCKYIFFLFVSYFIFWSLLPCEGWSLIPYEDWSFFPCEEFSLHVMVGCHSYLWWLFLFSFLLGIVVDLWILFARSLFSSSFEAFAIFRFWRRIHMLKDWFVPKLCYCVNWKNQISWWSMIWKR